MISTVNDLAGSLTRLAANSNADITLPVGELRVTVKLLDARLRFGKWDLLISPVEGYGHKWVAMDTLVAYDRDHHDRVALALMQQ